MKAQGLLESLAMVLCVAAAVTAVSGRLRVPAVIGYILSGFIIGPHIPFPLVADKEAVRVMAEAGVVLLMFSLGLDFSFTRLRRVLPTGGLAALIECGIMMLAGFQGGRLLGMGVRDSLLAGGIVTISSTTVVFRLFAERGVRGTVSETVMGILIVEDVIAILLLGLFAALPASGGVSLGRLAENAGGLASFLAAAAFLGIFLIPRAIRAVEKTRRADTLLIASVGFCFAGALIAENAGFSVALGAFLAGVLMSETGAGPKVEEMVRPLRDIFVAVFFVAIGMTLDPRLAAGNWAGALLFTGIVLAGKVLGVSLGAFLTGKSPAIAVQAGFSMAQIGEFSFMMAGLGAYGGRSGARLYALAVTVSVVTIALTPLLHRAAPAAAAWLDRHMPPRLRTFATMYGSWVGRLPEAWRNRVPRSRFMSLLRMTLLDAALLAATVAAASLNIGWILGKVGAQGSLPEGVALAVVGGGAGAVCLLLVVGLVRGLNGMADLLLMAVMPAPDTGRNDLNTTPRAVLRATFRGGAVLLVGIPLAAVLQPFLASVPGPVLVGAALAVTGYFLWRRTADLQGHVKAGSALVVELLKSQLGAGRDKPGPAAEEVPGIGLVVPFTVKAGDCCDGMRISQVDLRAQTGATILVINHGGERNADPPGSTVLKAGDVLMLAGSAEALKEARETLTEGLCRNVNGKE